MFFLVFVSLSVFMSSTVGAGCACGIGGAGQGGAGGQAGEQLTLEDGQDVSDSNDGILVYSDGDDDPVYLEWDEVEIVRFTR